MAISKDNGIKIKQNPLRLKLYFRQSGCVEVANMKTIKCFCLDLFIRPDFKKMSSNPVYEKFHSKGI